MTIGCTFWTTPKENGFHTGTPNVILQPTSIEAERSGQHSGQAKLLD